MILSPKLNDTHASSRCSLNLSHHKIIFITLSALLFFEFIGNPLPILSSVGTEEVKASSASWYSVDPGWINVTKSTYKLAIPRTSGNRGGIDYFWFNNSGAWVRCDSPYLEDVLIETEHRERHVAMWNTTTTIVKQTEHVLVVHSNSSCSLWYGAHLYVFWKDVDWFYTYNVVKFRQDSTCGFQIDSAWDGTFFDSDVYFLTQNGTVVHNSRQRNPISFNTTMQEFYWMAFKNTATNFTMGTIVLDVYPHAGIWVRGGASSEQQITWNIKGFKWKDSVYSAKILFYPHINNDENCWSKTRALSQDLYSSVNIERYYQFPSLYAYAMEAENTYHWEVENNFIHFGTDGGHLHHGFGRANKVPLFYGRGERGIYYNSTRTWIDFGSWTSRSVNITHPDVEYPPNPTHFEHHNWTATTNPEDYVSLKAFLSNNKFKTEYTVWTYPDSDKIFENVSLYAQTDLNITKFFWEYGDLAQFKENWNAEVIKLNDTAWSITWKDYDLGHNVSMVYMFSGFNKSEKSSSTIRAWIKNWGTNEHLFHNGDQIANWTVTYWFTETAITSAEQLNMDKHIFIDSKFSDGHNWFMHDLQNQSTLTNFAFYSNASVVETFYDGSKSLTLISWGSHPYGSGTDKMYIFCADKGKPAFVKVEGSSTPFNFNSTTKICDFNVTHSSATITEVEWGKPNRWQMTFDHKDWDDNIVDSEITWKLYNGTQLLDYTEGQYSLLDGTYTLKTFFHTYLINSIPLPTAVYGNGTIDILLHMKSYTYGYIILNATGTSCTIYSQTATNLTFTITGGAGELLIYVQHNAEYIKKDGSYVFTWTYDYPNHMILLDGPSAWELNFIDPTVNAARS